MFGSNSFGALAVETPPAAGPEPTEGEELDVDVSSTPVRKLTAVDPSRAEQPL